MSSLRYREKCVFNVGYREQNMCPAYVIKKNVSPAYVIERNASPAHIVETNEIYYVQYFFRHFTTFSKYLYDSGELVRTIAQ